MHKGHLVQGSIEVGMVTRSIRASPEPAAMVAGLQPGPQGPIWSLKLLGQTEGNMEVNLALG